jgi:TonB family protein
VNIAAADRAASLLAAAGRRSTLGARIESILDTERKRNMLSRRMAVASIAAVLTIGVPVAAMQADKDVYSVKDPGVTPPQLIDKHEPPYTKEARAKKIEGAVILKVVVAADGTVSDVTVRKGLDDGLDANAVSAVKTWKFKPAEKDGQPVAVRATVEVNFRVR